MIGLAGCSARRKRALLIGIALLLAIAGGLLVLVLKAEPSHGSGGRIPLFILIPIYAALIPIFIAAARRRRNNNDV